MILYLQNILTGSRVLTGLNKGAIAYFFTGWKRYEASYLNKGEITQNSTIKNKVRTKTAKPLDKMKSRVILYMQVREGTV